MVAMTPWSSTPEQSLCVGEQDICGHVVGGLHLGGVMLTQKPLFPGKVEIDQIS